VPYADPFADLRAFLRRVKEENGVALRTAEQRLRESGHPLSRETINTRLNGRAAFTGEREVEALVVAFGGGNDERRTARDRYRAATRRGTGSRRAYSADETGRSAGRNRAEVRALLEELLPASQLASGNGDMLAEVATDELQPGQRLLRLYPCRSAQKARGSAILMITNRDVVIVELEGNGVARSRRRAPRGEVQQVPLEPRRLVLLEQADLIIRWLDGIEWRCRGMRRDQARDAADLLRPTS
jgi:hypothetical protein